MEDSIITFLQNLVDKKAFRPKKNYGEPECENCDDCPACEELSDECDYFFEQGFKMGIQLAFECLQK